MVRDAAAPNVDGWGWATIYSRGSAVRPMHIHKFHNKRIRRPPQGCPRIRRPSDCRSLVSTLEETLEVHSSD